jgi:threonine 3-dehydrogenase
MDVMRALTFDRSRESWEGSTGMVLERVPRPTLEGVDDLAQVVIKVRYAGFCGTDRGIWARKSMTDMVLGSLDRDGTDKRIFGHELLGEIVEVGDLVFPQYGYQVGDVVSTESHIVCDACTQCRLGQHHVCANEQIIGVSRDGCFADYVKLPAKAIWPTDLSRIRPEVAAVQEPFGNAVHACQITDLRGKSVVILGTGTIGLFAVLVAKGMGARRVIGVDPDPDRRKMAADLGADHVLAPAAPNPEAPHRADRELAAKIHELTDGDGADVVLEMAGFPSSVNNAIRCVRRGGDVVLFGLRSGDLVVEDFHRIIMNGVQLHGVVGRRIFQTWEMTKSLLEQTDNGVQQAVWEIILHRGEGSIVDIDDFEPASFERTMAAFPKPLIRFAG